MYVVGVMAENMVLIYKQPNLQISPESHIYMCVYLFYKRIIEKFKDIYSNQRNVCIKLVRTLISDIPWAHY